MTLALYTEYVRNAQSVLDDLSANTKAAIDGKLIRPHDGNLLRDSINLTTQLANQALSHGTEVEVPRADTQTTRFLVDRPR